MEKLGQNQTILLYDVDCRFCTASSRQAVKFAPKGTIELQNVNNPTLQAQYRITPEAASREMHIVTPDGYIYKGAAAARLILVLSRWLWPLALFWYLPGFGKLAQAVYMWVSNHRYLFMGKIENTCDDGACNLYLGRDLNHQATRNAK